MKYFVIVLVSLVLSCVLSIPVSNDYGFSTEEQEDLTKEEDENNENIHPFGKPINLMKFDENENVIFDDDALKRTFMHPDVKDRKIISVCIVGAFRKGKSFLMDYALRYMYAHYKSVANPNNTLENKQNWIGDPEAPLKGFSWRGGSSKDTIGVVLWSDVFLYEKQNPKTGKTEKLAIILMDTQGLFDSSTSPTDNSRIFGLGTFISSLQIFNLNDIIQEYQLEYLQLATDFTRLIMKQNKQKKRNSKPSKPFQTLVFLMRDWQHFFDYEYGRAGGSDYLTKVLTTTSNQPKFLKEVRRYIKESFEERSCFLLPHPGSIVANNENFDGRFSELTEDFQEQLKDLLNWLLTPKNLKRKKILGYEVTGAEYLEYISAYFEAFSSDDIPKIETLYDITVRKQYDIVMQDSFEKYKALLQPIEIKVGEAWKDISIIEDEIKNLNIVASNKSLQIFESKEKMGTKNDEKQYEEELKKQLGSYFNEWKSKQLDLYMKFQKLEIQKQQDLDEINKQKEEKLKRVKEQADANKQRLEERHKIEIEQLKKTIDDVKSDVDKKMQKLVQELEMLRNDMTQQVLKISLNEMKAQQQRDEEFKLSIAQLIQSSRCSNNNS